MDNAEKLEVLRKEINSGYNDAEMVSVLSKFVNSNAKESPFLMKKCQKDQPKLTSTIEDKFSIDSFESVNCSNRYVNALPVHYEYNLTLSLDELLASSYRATYMGIIGRAFADLEYKAIVHCITTFPEVTVLKTKERGNFTLNDIYDAVGEIRRYGSDVNALLLIMSPELKTRIEQQGKIKLRDPTKGFPRDVYVGTMADIDLYRVNLDMPYVLMFQIGAIQVTKTPLRLVFDNTEDPKKIVLDELCASAPLFDKEVAKIEV